MLITVTASTDPTSLLGKPARHGHMVGRFTHLQHLVILPATGLSRMGLKPGMVGSFAEEPSAHCRGGNTSTYVAYGETIEIEDPL